MKILLQTYVERFLYLALLVVFLGSAYSTYAIFNITQVNKQNIVVICESSNRVRVAERQLWDYILTLPPSQSLNEEQKIEREQRIKEFITFLDSTFALEKCK